MPKSASRRDQTLANRVFSPDPCLPDLMGDLRKFTCPPSSGLTALIDLDDQQAILKLIDDRQDLLLEDLERLNRQILDIIEVYAVNRATDTQQPSQDAAA